MCTGREIVRIDLETWILRAECVLGEEGCAGALVHTFLHVRRSSLLSFASDYVKDSTGDLFFSFFFETARYIQDRRVSFLLLVCDA